MEPSLEMSYTLYKQCEHDTIIVPNSRLWHFGKEIVVWISDFNGKDYA